MEFIDVPQKKTLADIGLDSFSQSPLRFSGGGLNAKIPTMFEAGIPSNFIQDGDTIVRLNLVDGYLQSPDFVTGVSGWRIDKNSAEFLNGIFRGALSAATIDIGGSDSTSWHVDINGNMWWGSAGSYAASSIKISSTGTVNFTTGVFSGSITGGSINGVTITGSTITGNTIQNATGTVVIDGTGLSSANNFTGVEIASAGGGDSNSTSYVDVAGSQMNQITFSRSTNIFVYFEFAALNSAIGTDIDRGFYVQCYDNDTGAEVSFGYGTGIYTWVANHYQGVYFGVIRNLAAGNHTLKLRYKCTSGGGRTYWSFFTLGYIILGN